MKVSAECLNATVFSIQPLHCGNERVFDRSRVASETNQARYSAMLHVFVPASVNLDRHQRLDSP